MKKLIYVTLIGLFFISCSKNSSNDDEQTSTSLIGSWVFVSSTTDGVPDVYTSDCIYLWTFTFTETTLSITFYNGESCVPDTVSNAYTLDGSLISVSNNTSLTIITLTNDTLVLEEIEDNIIVHRTTFMRKT